MHFDPGFSFTRATWAADPNLSLYHIFGILSSVFLKNFRVKFWSSKADHRRRRRQIFIELGAASKLRRRLSNFDDKEAAPAVPGCARAGSCANSCNYQDIF